MATVIHTKDFFSSIMQANSMEDIIKKYGSHDTHCIYNGLDCIITEEVLRALLPQAKQVQRIYDLERRLQAVCIAMQYRGIRVNTQLRSDTLKKLEDEIKKYQEYLNRMAVEVWGKGLNPESSQQIKTFFYTVMGCREIKSRVGGDWKPSADRDALEKLREGYYLAAPIINVILHLRDLQSSIEVLSRKIDSDGRYRPSFSIAGTVTGRFSSSKNIFDTAGNVQNITEELRNIFIPDNGWKLGYADYEQAESKLVGLMAWIVTGKDTYLKATFSGDLHTLVAKMVWPYLDWPNDNGKGDRKVADEIFYRHFSYRDLSKRGGHLSNYYGQPKTAAERLKIPLKTAENFQKAYFEAFPEIPDWHQYTNAKLHQDQTIVTPFGRRRTFFGRVGEPNILREAIAHGPQSCIADMLNDAMHRIHIHELNGAPIQMLAQVHDAVLFQYRENAEDEMLKLVANEMEQPLEDYPNFFIPSEVKVGWNWASIKTDKDGNVISNPYGMMKLKAGKKDVRNFKF